MNEILIIFLLISNYLCCDITHSTQVIGVSCGNFKNGVKICNSQISGELKIANGQITCYNLVYNTTDIGEIRIKVKYVYFKPDIDFENSYWTYGHRIYQDRITKTDVFLAEASCQESSFFNNNFCKCLRHCKTIGGAFDMRDCGGIFNFTDTFIGYTDCDFCSFLSGVRLSDFYTFTLKPIQPYIYQMLPLLTSGRYQADLEIEFIDTSETDLNDQNLPKNLKSFTLFGGSKNILTDFGITITSHSLDTGLNPPPSNIKVLRPYSGTECFQVNNAKIKNDFPGLGIGEIQLEEFNNNLDAYAQIINPNKNVGQIISPSPSLYFLNNDGVKVSASILTKIPNTLCSSAPFNVGGQFYDISVKESSIMSLVNNPISSNLGTKLPYSAGIYQLRCEDENEFTDRIIYQIIGDFTFTLNYIMDAKYSFIQQSNEICPEIIDCSIMGGFKNSTKGSFMVIKAHSTCLSGSSAISFINTNDARSLYPISSSHIELSDTLIQTYNVSFHINTPLKTIIITITLEGNFGHEFSCSQSYTPLLPDPDDAGFTPNPRPPSPLPNISCIIFCPTDNCKDFFSCIDDFFKQFFNFDNIFKDLLVIGIFIIIGAIIFLIIYCVITSPKTNVIGNNTLLGNQPTNQPNINININKDDL